MQDELENNKANTPQVPPDSAVEQSQEATNYNADSTSDEYSMFQDGGNEETRKRQKRATEGSIFAQLKKKWAEAKAKRAEEQAKLDIQANRKKARKITLIGSGVFVVVVGIVLAFVFLTPSQYLHNDIVIGDEIISEEDILAYIASLQEFMDNNPGLTFGDDLRAVAEADLIINAALRFYSSGARCDIPLTNRILFEHRNGNDIGSEDLARQLLEKDLGPVDMVNFRRIRAENAAFKVLLEDCVIQNRHVFRVYVTWAGLDLFYQEEHMDDILIKYRNHLERVFLPMFEQGFSNEMIAAHADIDYYTGRDFPAPGEDKIWHGDFAPTVAAQNRITAELGLNDIPDRDYGNINFPDEIVILTDVLMELEVGQHTGVLMATNGTLVISRLSSLSDGFHISWDAMVESYIRESRNRLGVARDALLGGIMRAVGMLTRVGTSINEYINIDVAGYANWARCNLSVPDGPGNRWRHTMNNVNYCVNYYNPCTAARTFRGKHIVFALEFRDPNGAFVTGNMRGSVTYTHPSARYTHTSCTEPLSTSDGTIRNISYNCLVTNQEGYLNLPEGWVFDRIVRNATSTGGVALFRDYHGSVGQPRIYFTFNTMTNINDQASGAGVIQLRSSLEFESHSTANVTVPGGIRVTGPDSHRSGWNSTNTVTYKIPASVPGTVTAQIGFHHDMRRPGTSTTEAPAVWEVMPMPLSGPLSIPPVNIGPPTGRVYLLGGSEQEVSRTHQVPIQVPATTAQMNPGATAMQANVQLVNVSAGDAIETCQRITHGPGNANHNPNTGDGGGGNSMICVRIIRYEEEEEEEEPDITCTPHYICGVRIEQCVKTWQESGFRHGQSHTFPMRQEIWEAGVFGSYTRIDELLTETFTKWNWACIPIWNSCCSWSEWSGCSGCWVGCNQTTSNHQTLQHQGVFMNQTGNTNGRSFARNSRTPNPANRDNWWYMGDLPADALYARPGDQIDFCHGSFRGAQMVQHNQPGVQQVRNNSGQNWKTITAWAGKNPQDIHAVLNPFRTAPQRPVLGRMGVFEERSAQQTVRYQEYTIDVGQRYQQRFTTGAENANTVPRRAQPGRMPGATTQNCAGCPPGSSSGFDSTVYNHDLGTNLGTVGGTHETDYAIIRVPFNYRIEIDKQTDHTQSGRQWVTPTGAITTAPGSAWTIDARFHVRPVINDKLREQRHTAYEYATHTKDTEWRLVKSITPPTIGGYRGRFNATVGAEDNRVNQTAPCSELLGLTGGGICDTAIHRDALTGTQRLEDFNRVFNHPTAPSGRTNLEIGSTEDVMATPKGFYVDDLPAGSMICYMFSVFPATGYDRQGQQYADLDNTNPGDSWVHSQPVCVIVGKRPSATVQGAGLYAGGTIVTNQTTKTPCFSQANFTGVNGAGVNPCWDGRPEPGRSVFGSWSEYEIIAGSSFDGWMSSGAAFAYTPIPRTTGLSGRNTLTAFRPSSRWVPGAATIGFNFDAGTGGQDFPDTAIDHPADSLDHGRLTLANEGGGFGGFPLNLNTAQLIARLSQLDDFEAPGDGGVNRVIRRTNSTISGMSLGSGIQLGQTILYLVNSDVTITGDIAIDAQLNNLVDLPQVIIMAPNIHIMPNVSRVDAWLITAQQVGMGQWELNPNGTIHTCFGHNAVTNVDAMINCANGQIPLVINGPVIVGGSGTSLRMLRTAGAGVGIESADPAEVFNLRADTYLWIFQRIQANRSVRTTFTHEMPPRL